MAPTLFQLPLKAVILVDRQVKLGIATGIDLPHMVLPCAVIFQSTGRVEEEGLVCCKLENCILHQANQHSDFTLAASDKGSDSSQFCPTVGTQGCRYIDLLQIFFQNLSL